jgi:signal transduction histidine kinase/ligand-binding sensor domain-containing protein
MIRWFVRISLWAALAMASTQRANALNPDRLMSQYVQARWGSDRGLLGEVHAITQTSDGYLWIGSEKGLFRFDGQSFESVTDRSPSALPITQVLGLTVDAQGNLIVRLPERNLLRYSDGVFENTLRSLQPRELAVTAMAQGNNQALLVSGLTNGTLRYSGGRFETIVPVSALPSSPIIALAQSSDGKVWLGTRDAGLFYAEHEHTTAVTKGLPSRKIVSLLAVGNDVWVGTDAGIARWNGTKITTEGVPPSLRRTSALAMLMDRQSNLWIGTTAGILRLNSQGIASLKDPESRAPSVINTLFEDREGNLWSGGPWGIERLSDEAFTTYGRPEGLPSDHVGAVFADSDGRTWFAPIEGGLFWLDQQQRGRITDAGLNTDVVYSIAGGKDGLWVGRQRGGLTHLHLRGGTLVEESYTQATGLAQNSVYSVYQSRDGTIWAGTLNGGVSKLQRGRITTYSAKDGLSSNTVASILEDSDGTMWFGTPDGLSALSNGRWLGYTANDGLPSNDVNCLAQDSKGTLWVGTSGGLAFLSASEIKVPQQAPESLREPIFGIAEDRLGWLWLVTAKQVVHVNRDTLLRGALTDGDLRLYGLDDGLRSVEGIRRQKSVVVDPQGRIWASMSSGLSVVDPAQLVRSTAPAIVHVLSISADGSLIDAQNVAKVGAPPSRLTFVYSGLSLRHPDRVRFRYELEGYDKGLSRPTTAHEATYTKLGPGSYTFRVIASNSDGVWNAMGTAVALEIAPLFWQTWWFRLSVISICALGILGLYRMRLHRLSAQLNLRFEERLDERARIAQELHDTLLQGVLSASMRLHVAVDQLPEDSPAKKSLASILDLMKQVTEEGRNAVQGLRSSDGVLLDLPQAFSRIRDDLALADDVEFRVIVDGNTRRLHPILRDEVYRIGREALVNAARHSQAKSIEVEVEYTDKQLRVLVRDNGCGIDPGVLRSGREGHWGLPDMRERAERIGGRLRIWSGAKAGTEVELSVPGNIAFESKSPTLLQKCRSVWTQRNRLPNRL